MSPITWQNGTAGGTRLNAANLNLVETDIANAQTAATNAQSTANSATTAASNAQSAADTAHSAATTAQTTADTAQTAANTAQTSANNAQTAANTAQTAADAAQTTADSANTAAGTAQTTANNAQSAATSNTTSINTINSTAVFNGDARLSEVADVESLLFAVTDSVDRRTWVEAGLDGNPTPTSATRISTAIGLQDATLDSGQQFAVVDPQDKIIFTPPRDHPTDDWAHWGDSLTDNLMTGTGAWVTQLAALTGRDHYNGGWYNETAVQIGARQGALPALVTVSGNVLATSGATSVTSIVNSPVLTSTTRTVHGTLAGVPGLLAQPADGTITFTPDFPGTAAPIPAKSRFTPQDGLTYRDRTVTLWAGRNDLYNVNAIPIILSTLRGMVDYLTPFVKRIIVMEIPPKDDNPIGSPSRATLDGINTAIQNAFPAYWLPIATYMRTADAATVAGITYTAQDQTDIANGITPTSFRLTGDGLHFNPTGCTAIAHRVYLEAQTRGWLA